MSVVNYETGEMVDLDAGAAERRAMKISLRLDTIADNYEAVMPMIREAIALRDDMALGYRSPGDYVSDRFGATLSRLGVEVRREVVRELTRAGMSTRAIAPVVGVHHDTVARDVRRVVGTTPGTPAPAPEGEAEADAGITSQGEETAPSPGVEVPSEAAPDQPAPRPAVTGIDGKRYTPPRLRQAQRDDAETYLNLAQSYADKAAKQVGKLTAAQIERVKPNAALWVGGIGESVETLQRLLTSLTEEK
jgi:hypothetical protein